MKLFFTFLLTSSFLITSAQTYTWQRMYGDERRDAAAEIVQLPDGDYVFVGYSQTSTSDSSQILLCKTDRVGNAKWRHIMETSGNSQGYDLAIVPNEGLIVAGSITDTLGSSDMYIAKVDFGGNLLWERTYGGTLNDEAFSIKVTADGGYIIAGYTETATESEELALIKVDNNGMLQWQNQYGGAMNERAQEVIITSDGGYAVTGFTESFGNGMKDLFLIKTDFVGNEMWLQTYGNRNNQVGYSLVQNEEGGFVITGSNEFSSYYPEDLFLLGADANGTELWSNSYGGDSRLQGLSISPIPEGGYIVAGSRSTFFGFYPSDFYLFRIDDRGIKLWDRDFPNQFPAVANSITATQDGGFIIAGWAQPTDDETTQDAQLIKTDALGRIDTTFQANIENNSPLACFGDANGQVDVWVTGGEYPYTYDWAQLATDTFNVDNLAAAIYQVTVTDKNGRQMVKQSTVTTPDSLMLTPENISNTSCPESLDGVARIAVSGGTAPFGYLWETGTSTATDSTLRAGTYQVTVIDANACQATTVITVASANSIEVTITAQETASCTDTNDGRLAVNISGGNAPFTYQLDDRLITAAELNTLAAGDYSLIIHDANGCRMTQEFTIGQAATEAPTAAFSQQITDLSVSFTAQLTESDSAYWDFGNGNFSSELNPIYEFPTGGEHLVCLTAFNACGSTTACNNVSLVDCSNAAIDTDFQAVSNNTIVTFTNISAGNVDSYRWRFGDGGSSQSENPTYTYAEPGHYEVCLTARNLCGSYTFCDSVRVELASEILIDVAGQIEMIDGQPMEAVTVKCGALIDTTNLNGGYSLQTSARSNCAITPEKDDRAINGVSTFDILLTRKHILNLEPFTSPYQYIAADVNNSGTVTSFDMIFMRRLILNLIDKFPDVPSWRFVPKDYEFPDGSFQGFPESVALNSFENSRSDVDFVGIKTGDVNNSAVPNLQGGLEERSMNSSSLIIDNQSFTTGEVFTVPIRMGDKASGFQFALNIGSELEILDIEPANIANLAKNSFNIKNQKIATVWWTNGEMIDKDQVIFNLKLQAKQTGQLSHSISLNQHDIVAETYDLDLAIAQLDLQFESPTNDLNVQISPNPAQSVLQMELNNSITNSVQIQLVHTSGKIVKEWTFNNPEKINALNVSDLPTGIYLLTVDNGMEQVVRKVIKK